MTLQKTTSAINCDFRQAFDFISFYWVKYVLIMNFFSLDTLHFELEFDLKFIFVFS